MIAVHTNEQVHSICYINIYIHIIAVHSRAKKSVAGYDLSRLFVASEGTLGIITEATLRVYPIASHRMALLVSFASLDALLACVAQLVRADAGHNKLELLDRHMVRCLNRKLRDLK